MNQFFNLQKYGVQPLPTQTIKHILLPYLLNWAF